MPSLHETWIRQAESDLVVAKELKGNDRWCWAAFCAQQAAEKAAKALVYAAGATPPTSGKDGHAINKVLGHLPDLPDSKRLRDAASALLRHESGARYPDLRQDDRGLPPAIAAPADFYTERVAEEAIENAEIMIRFCRSLIPIAAQRWAEVCAEARRVAP